MRYARPGKHVHEYAKFRLERIETCPSKACQSRRGASSNKAVPAALAIALVVDMRCPDAAAWKKPRRWRAAGLSRGNFVRMLRPQRQDFLSPPSDF
jgi:hypothetical protein